MAVWTQCVLVASLLVAVVVCDPLRHEQPLSEISKSLSSHVAPHLQDPRLPLPTPQELEAIKKVAQILVMLGEQVIPAIIGDQPSSNCCDLGVVDTAEDPVEP